jgi:protein O-mannosyl-transferase
LVYALGILLLGDSMLALALAALWGLHPLLTESVTNIVGRADLLAASGVLAGLLCYLTATKFTGWRLAGLCAAQTLALFSKESGVVLPVLVLLCDAANRGPRRPSGAAYRMSPYAALAVPIAAFLAIRFSLHLHMIVNPAENPLVQAGFWTSRLTALAVLGKLAWLFVWPVRLSADYSYDAVPLFSGRDLQAILALALVAGGAVVALCARRKNPITFLFAGWFFIALAPTANLLFPIGSIMAERFMYLPAVGLAGCVVMAMARWMPRKTALGAIALLFVGAGARTYVRNGDWKDELTFWRATADASPMAARAHNNFGNALAKVPGRVPAAIGEFRTARRIEPAYADAHYYLGNALAQNAGGIPEAVAEYQTALRIQPDYAEAHANLGKVLVQIPGRVEDAIGEFRAALRADPDPQRTLQTREFIGADAGTAIGGDRRVQSRIADPAGIGTDSQ